MPSVHGVLETALYVSNLQQSAAFYRRLFCLGTLSEMERLVALDVAGRTVLLLFEKGATQEPLPTSGGVIPGHGATGEIHFAFSIAAEDVPRWQERLQREGVAIESTVNWPGGAQSLYFRDPDRNLVELVTPGLWSIY